VKRTLLLLLGVTVIAVGIGATRVFVQSEKALTDTPDNGDVRTDALPPGRIGDGRTHKIFVNSNERETYDSLVSRGVVVREVDYDSFKMLIVNEDLGIGRAELAGLKGEIRDEQDLIAINDYVLDTSNGKVQLSRTPGDLRQTAMADSLIGNGNAGKGLYIVQFIGPVKDEWLESLRATGARIVTYLPENAYVVEAGRKAALGIPNLRGNDFVQYVGDYEPTFRLSPTLQSIRNLNQKGDVPITVQVVDGPDAPATIKRLREMATEFVGVNGVLDYQNVELRVDSSSLGADYDQIGIPGGRLEP